MIFPEMTTPEDLAHHMGWSERRVRELARKLGACRILGNRMVLTEGDVDAILEASRPCPLKSTNEAVSGITGGQLPSGDYAALRELRTKKERLRSRRKSKNGHGNVVLMARERS